MKYRSILSFPWLLAAVAGLTAFSAATTAATTTVVETPWLYEHGETTLEGVLVHDDDVTGPRPGVLVVHQWMGVTGHERERARRLAEMGHVVLVADVYGQGVRPADREEAAAQAGIYYGDRDLFRARVAAGLEQLRRHELVDGTRIAAIGYCFGGGGVLELARSGADLAGVVSFHGSLDTPQPAGEGDIRAKILVCHGAVDPYVKPEAVDGFIDEMEAAGADYQLIMYAHAVHAFTQKSAGDDPSRGAAYNAKADARSWRHMQVFFDEILE